MNDRNDSQQVSLGQRLRQSREQRGLSQQQVAEQLHLPLSVVMALEDERFEQLGAPIYLRGHLRSYLRLLELPQVLVEGVLQQVGQAPPVLRTTTYTPRLRFLFDRYAMRAVYVLLTLSIILPALWVATQHAGLGGLQRDARLLDQVPQAPLHSVTSAPADDSTAALGPPAVAEQGRETVVASMAPFYTATPPEAAVTPAPDTDPGEGDAEPAAGDQSGWLLRFNEASWVEIVGRDGQRIEYGLIPAASERRYPPGRLARVALGNAGGVEVRRGAEALDLQPFRRANVARFAVSSDGSLQPSSD
jgi:cytoskeleton protein RodZ